ncbi:MAG: threonylcarbamoyl-AMP synthase [Thermoplasmata archaeon]|nr:MAG: threonylcarbamoyl-AMP synthase [Thermoplasmata archaeon]RLF32035.1 MAG: threonylcarbamoyl-AMP synthase [Thermoplasmata archaeon]RLF37434.1 MAG: threonylcarbamoyl-AMP synthase [Thermoplasmata archaeon]RLF53307.1 MAG: threonylcarbamoyl-AMP synthase [Thermoplasmata archaeon]
MVMLDVSEAVVALSKGELVVYPTDTLYGIGADVYNEVAVRKVFEIKKRPLSNPLPIAVSDFEMLEKVAYVDDKAMRLADFFLPGKLTLVLKKKDAVSDVVTAGGDKVAVRIPGNKVALELLSRFGGPITATSANVHGMKTPSVINEIRMQFKNQGISVYLDTGRVAGKPSTVVDVTGETVRVIRVGEITEKEILDVIQHG